MRRTSLSGAHMQGLYTLPRLFDEFPTLSEPPKIALQGFGGGQTIQKSLLGSVHLNSLGRHKETGTACLQRLEILAHL
jgi:hypothetical protein